MAISRFSINGFGQVELNNVAFRRDGRIEAQCALNSSDFASAKLENGMFVAVDKAKKEVKLPTNASLPIALVYSAEHLYDEAAMGLKDFALGLGDVLPREGYLAKGDIYTTNTFQYDTTEFTSVSALESALNSAASTSLYGKLTSSGFLKVTATAPASSDFGPACKVVEYTTMPDGQKAVKFQVIAE